MADFVLKQHDTWPPVQAILSDQNGPINLTGCTIKFLLKSSGTGMATVSGACTIVGAPTAGTVSYQWVSGDTAAVNSFTGEFEITWPSGVISTVPNDSYFTVNIIPDLG